MSIFVNPKNKEGFNSASYKGIGSGYENPFGGNAPSWKQDYDWGGASKGINWDSKFGIDKEGLFERLFDKSRNTDKYRSWGEQGFRGGGGQFGASFGDPIYGRGNQVLDNLSVLYPQQHAPMFIPGAEGKRGLGSTIGTLAGIGASFIPGLGPGIAAAMPAIGGNIGSMFG